MNLPVPVIMYHSVGVPNKKWMFNYLTCPYQIFENQLKWLKNRGFHTINLDELYSYMSKGIGIPKKSIVLTFDDSYGDNWVFAYPILKKYGMKATVYVNPEFIEYRKEKNNLDDVWGKKLRINDLDTLGYLSWEELKIMEDNKIFDVQSHTMTHTWYPYSENVLDFRHPQDSYFWMTWNENVKRKPHLQTDNENLVKYGQPVYENGRSIEVKRYFPDKELDQFMIEFYDENSKSFENNFNKKLITTLNQYKLKNTLNDRYETDKEYKNRIYHELNESKRILEKKLKKEIKFLCWPGGAVTQEALDMASEIGYLSSTAGKDLGKYRNYFKNQFGDTPSRINRIGNSMYWDGVEGPNSKIVYKNGLELLLAIYNFQNRKILSKISFLSLGIINKFNTIKNRIGVL